MSGKVLFSSRGLALGCLALAAGYFLVMRHWQHVVEFLPYVILLVCPLMHVFGGHGGHKGHHHASPDSEDAAYKRGVEDGRKLGGN